MFAQHEPPRPDRWRRPGAGGVLIGVHARRALGNKIDDGPGLSIVDLYGLGRATQGKQQVATRAKAPARAGRREDSVRPIAVAEMSVFGMGLLQGQSGDTKWITTNDLTLAKRLDFHTADQSRQRALGLVTNQIG